MPNTNTEEGLEKRNCYRERRLEALKWSKTHQERDGYTSSKPHLLSFRGLWNGGENATRSQAAAAEKKIASPFFYLTSQQLLHVFFYCSVLLRSPPW
jgi:hypothetical protein